MGCACQILRRYGTGVWRNARFSVFFLNLRMKSAEINENELTRIATKRAGCVPLVHGIVLS